VNLEPALMEVASAKLISETLIFSVQGVLARK